jgi:hypothetical protein
MISRWRFLEQMSRPYGLELFFKRPLYSLYRFASAEVLKLKGETPIVEAARHSKKRSPQILYDTKSDPIAPFWVLVVETYPTLREPLWGTGTARLTPSFANAEPPERLYKAAMSQSVWGSLVFFLAHAASPAMLIAAADAALYQAKSLGRDRVILHPLLNQLQFQR